MNVVGAIGGVIGGVIVVIGGVIVASLLLVRGSMASKAPWLQFSDRERKEAGVCRQVFKHF